MADVQPMLYIEDPELGIEFYCDLLGFDVAVFGHDVSSITIRRSFLATMKALKYFEVGN